MRVREIISYASNNLVKEPVNEADAIDWINDALREIGIGANRLTDIVVIAQSGKWNNLPVDCIRVYEVRDEKDNAFHNYIADQGRIKFYSDGTYTVTYYEVPAAVNMLDDEPQCHLLIQQALPYYIAARYIDPRTEDEANIWLGEYQQRLNNALGQLQQKRPRIMQLYRRWT